MTDTISMVQQDEDERYEEFLQAIRRRFDAVMAAHTTLFVTDVTGLFDAFLGALPEQRRQHYKCNACRRFVERFGGLVAIDEQGATIPVMWSGIDVPQFFREATTIMARVVARAKVVGVHVSDEMTWGMPSNSSKVAPFEWRHVSIVPPERLVFRS
jgi:hypothetical protein